MKARIFLTSVLLTLFLNACQSKGYGKWSESEIENARKSAQFAAQADPDLKTEEQRQKFVDCWVEKVIIASPDPMKQAEIPMDQVIKMNEDCRAQALR